MKIGIITIPPYYNYGGILQAYALSHVLKGLGFEAEIIYKKKKWELSGVLKFWTYTKRAIKKYIFREPAWIFWENKNEREWPIVTQYTLGFVRKYIPYRVVGDYSSIREHDYDVFLLGSDQVWRPCYFNGDIVDAYLKFTIGWKVKRIAYAVSFGVDKWEYTPTQTKECADLVKLFDFVSVRESSAVQLCKEHLHINAVHVLDPTLLLNRENYEGLIKYDSASHKGEIFNYILDWNEEKRRFIADFEKSTGKNSFSVHSRIEDWSAPLEERIQPGVETWLQGIRSACYVITDSFHACVFSIIFNRPFFVICNEDRGLARITSLLSMFGLESRLIHLWKSIDECDQIDWKSVNERLWVLRTKSEKYLKDSLNSL